MPDENRDADEGVTGRTRFESTVEDSRPASFAVVRAIAAIENVDPTASPTELEFTLYEHVNPEALDALVATDSERSPLVIEFTVDEYRIRVENSGRLVVVHQSDSRAGATSTSSDDR